jgi:hypothetical protein
VLPVLATVGVGVVGAAAGGATVLAAGTGDDAIEVAELAGSPVPAVGDVAQALSAARPVTTATASTARGDRLRRM